MKTALIKCSLTLISVSSTCCSYNPNYNSCITPSSRMVNDWSKARDFLKDAAFSCASQKNGALWSVTPPDSSLSAAVLVARKKRHLTPWSCVAYSTVCVAQSQYLHSKRTGKVVCLYVCVFCMWIGLLLTLPLQPGFLRAFLT